MVDTPPTAGKVARRLGESFRSRTSTLLRRSESYPMLVNSGEGRGCRMRNSRSGVTSSTANGAVVQPGQIESPIASPSRNASARRMRSSGASVGAVDATSATGADAMRAAGAGGPAASGGAGGGIKTRNRGKGGGGEGGERGATPLGHRG